LTCNLAFDNSAPIINRFNDVVVARTTLFLGAGGAFSSPRLARKFGACVRGDWTFFVYAEIPALAITFSIADVFTRILVLVVTLGLGCLEWVWTKPSSFVAGAFHVALSFWFTSFLSFALVLESRAGTGTLGITLIIDCVLVVVVTLCSSFLPGVRTTTCATKACSSNVTWILCSTLYFFVCTQVATLAYAGTIAFIVACFGVVVVALEGLGCKWIWAKTSLEVAFARGMARALGLTTFTRTLVNTSTNGVCVALVISRFNFFVIALRANVDGVAAFTWNRGGGGG
jgi:hypothetical protein